MCRVRAKALVLFFFKNRPIFPKLFVKDAIFSPVYSFEVFVKIQMSVIGHILTSVFLCLIDLHLCFCASIMLIFVIFSKYNLRSGMVIPYSFLSRSFWLSEVFVIPYDIFINNSLLVWNLKTFVNKRMQSIE